MEKENLPKAPRSTREGALLQWVNGNPVPVYSPPLDNQQIAQVARASLSLEYEPKKQLDGEVVESEKKYVSHTNLEVMFMRSAQNAAEGDLESASFVLDRVLGKPKQHSETVVINTTLEQALHAIADQMEIDDAVSVTDVTPTSVLD